MRGRARGCPSASYQRPAARAPLTAGVDRVFPDLGLQIHAEVYVNPLHALGLLPELAPDRLSVVPSAARTPGAEATVRYRPSRTLNAWFSYSRGEAEDRVESQCQP